MVDPSPAPGYSVPDASGAFPPEEAARRTGIRRVFSRVGFACIALVLGALLLQAALAALFPAQMRALLASDWGYLAYALLPQYLIGAPLFFLLLRRLPRGEWAGERLAPRDWWRCLLMCFGLGFGGSLIGRFVTLLLSLVLGAGAVNPLEELLTSTAVLPQLVSMVLFAPVMEELLFRKLLIDRLHRFGDRAAIAVSALVFGLLHGNFSQLFYAFFIGLLLGYVYCRTHRLLYTILLHAAVNLIGGVLPSLLLSLSGTAVFTTLLSVALLAVYLTGLIRFFSWQKLAVFAPGELPLGRSDRGAVLGNAGMILYCLLCAGLCVFSLF